MTQLTVKLSYTEAARSAYAVLQGGLPATVLTVPLPDMTPEQRAAVLQVIGVPSDGQASLLYLKRGGFFHAEQVPTTPEEWVNVAQAFVNAQQAAQVSFDAENARKLTEKLPLLTAFEALNDAELQHQGVGEYQLPELPDAAYSQRRVALFGRLMTLQRAATARRKSQDAEASKARAASSALREEKKEAAAAAAEADKLAWIKDHGSDFLKFALENGYDCKQRYVTERVALEFPGYAVDGFNNGQWDDRTCPSEAALYEAVRVGGTVMWIKVEPTHIDAEWSAFEPCEGVVISGFLGYDLLKLMR